MPEAPVRSSRLLPVLLLALSACGSEPSGEGARTDPGAADPLTRPADVVRRAPARYRARLETTRGVVVVDVHRDWAPRAADRFYSLVEAGWYDGVRFHRVLEGFVAEWGIHGDPWVNAAWRQAEMPDDERRVSNTRGRVTFSQHGPGTRTTQVFVNLEDNPELDGQGFTPFGEVVEGMDAVDALYDGYGDGPPRGENGVYQAMAIARGDAYLDGFPELDRIERAVIEGEGADEP